LERTDSRMGGSASMSLFRTSLMQNRIGATGVIALPSWVV
jgi:hypothetical protein